MYAKVRGGGRGLCECWSEPLTCSLWHEKRALCARAGGVSPPPLSHVPTKHLARPGSKQCIFLLVYTTLQVDEEGTEAAAVTAIKMMRAAMRST